MDKEQNQHKDLTVGALKILPKVSNKATTSDATRLSHMQLITTLMLANDAFILQHTEVYAPAHAWFVQS